METTKLGPITKGTWSVVDGPQYGPYNALKRVDSTAGTFGTVICERFIAQAIVANEADREYLANFNLIVDAGNTANKCNRLPSELLEERDALKKERDELMGLIASICDGVEQAASDNVAGANMRLTVHDLRTSLTKLLNRCGPRTIHQSMSKERPILFSGPMVRAILEGRKTQTRRVVKPQPIDNQQVDGHFYAGDHSTSVMMDGHPNWRTQFAFQAARWQPGDRLWVRETHLVRGAGQVVDYRADMDSVDAAGHGAFYGGWKPSLFMRREHSRITLEVVSVRVERLNDCSITDALAEGIITDDEWPVDPRDSYRSLWESINGPGSWDANPWVWVIEFKRIKP